MYIQYLKTCKYLWTISTIKRHKCFTYLDFSVLHHLSQSEIKEIKNKSNENSTVNLAEKNTIQWQTKRSLN